MNSTLANSTPANIAVDIGNTDLKCGIFTLNGELCGVWRCPAKGFKPSISFLRTMLRWDTLTNLRVDRGNRKIAAPAVAYPEPLAWWIAQTGKFPWQQWQEAILSLRPNDKFKMVTRRQIPLKRDVKFPTKVGIDRLLAAYAAVKVHGEVPMLIVDAGTAITIDLVQNQTFCGGAILPGLAAQAATYPNISANLPLVSIPDAHLKARSVYPGKSTQEAIQSGLYWGTIGAIRQFYDTLRKQNAPLILSGGDAEYLLPGLVQNIPTTQFKPHLVLEGIHWCGFR